MPTIFTRIINGEIPGRFVVQDDICVAFLDVRPLARGHVLVVPRDEVDHWVDLSPEVASHLMVVAQRVGSAQRKLLSPARIGMMIAGDEDPVARGLIRRLVLNDIGPLIPASGMEPIADRVGRAPDFDDLETAEAYQKQACAEWGALSDETWMHLTLHSLQAKDGGGFAYHHDPAIGDALRALGPMRDIELWPWWRRIECPLLVLRGAESNILLAETAAEMKADGAELIEYPGIGHTPSIMVEDQIEAVTGWLNA